MNKVITFYLSRIIGNKVYSNLNNPIGKIKDLIVQTGIIRPKVVAISIKTSDGIINVDFSKIEILKENGQYVLRCYELKEISLDREDFISLARYIMDRQIVDINGKKIVRVNDIRLDTSEKGTYLVAVDVGFEGLFRRLGIAKQLKMMLNYFGSSIPSYLILWDDVEEVDFGHSGIKLSKEQSNINRFSPSDLSYMVRDLDRDVQIAMLSSAR